MKKSVKIRLIIAACLLTFGIMMFAVVLSFVQWDFSVLDTGNYETNNYKITENFDSIALYTNTANIELLYSTSGECRVECFEEANQKHFCYTDGGTLNIKLNDNRKWYDCFGFWFKNTKITVYLPKLEFNSLNIEQVTGDVKIPDGFIFKNIDIKSSTGDVTSSACASDKINMATSTGNIHLSNISAKSIKLSASTGNITLNKAECAGELNANVSTGKIDFTDINCKSFSSSGSTGKVTLKNVLAKSNLYVRRSTGNIDFERCDAKELYLKTSTGNIKGTLNSEKVFITKSSTGSINVPKTVTGGKCEVQTSTGDIYIKISD